jgi:hypothetical protein
MTSLSGCSVAFPCTVVAEDSVSHFGRLRISRGVIHTSACFLCFTCGMVQHMDSRSAAKPSSSFTWSLRGWMITAMTTIGLLLATHFFPAQSRLAWAYLALGALIGLIVSRSNRHSPSSRQRFSDGAVPASLNRHPELQVFFISLRHSLTKLAKQSDPILRDAAAVRLAAIQEETSALSEGRIVFVSTEAWRTVYERILRTPGLERYLSVAWLRNEDYWRDVPGQHSMQLNYDLVQLGVRIERTLILNDFFWPPGATLPAKVICQWIEEQYKRGIVVRLVRESEIEDEPELLCDFGIYGHRATGQLDLDEQCRAERFTLDFTPQKVRLFEERWRRLLLFTVTFRDVLDRTASGT